MKKLSRIVFVFTLMFFSCHDYKYSKSVQRDAARIFKLRKQFFKSLSFSGIINERKYCENCQLNKYQINIALKEKKPEIIDLGNLSYQPYYFISDNRQLTISVTRHIYESLSKGYGLEKKAESDSLICQGQQYLLLSEEETQWLAK